jgi:CHAT domain-containing protein
MTGQHGGEAAPDPADLFPRVVVERWLRCGACGHAAAYPVPQLIDWRDRTAIDLVKRCVPVVGCQGCGEPVPLDTPVMVLRPADPVALLVGFPEQTTLEADSAIVGELLNHPAVSVLEGEHAFVPVALAELAGVCDRYTGFALADLTLEPPEDWAEAERHWLAAVEEMVDVPDLRSGLRQLLTVADDTAATEVARHAHGLLDPAWTPVIDELVRRTVAEQVDPGAAEAVRRRSFVPRRQKMGEAAVIDEASLPPDVVQLLEQATQGSDPFALPRITALTSLIEDLRTRPDATVALTAALISYAAAISRSPGHAPGDLETALSSTQEAIPLASHLFGPSHEITRRARQNYAALLLDRQRGDPAENEREAMAVLTEVARSAIREADRDLADVFQNWAAALSHHTVGGRIDNQVRAMELHYDALHMHRVLRPLDRRGDLLIRSNLAAALRERRTGNLAGSTREAIRIYQEILHAPGHLDLLDPVEKSQAAANLVSAEYQLHELAPDEVPTAEVVQAAREAVVLCGTLPEGVPERIRTLSNVGSVLTDIGRESGPADEAAREAAALALRLTGSAYQEACQWLPPGHDERLRVGVNYAAALLSSNAATQADHDQGAALLQELLDSVDPERQAAVRQVIATNLGRWRSQLGQWTGAVAAFELALDAVRRLYRDARTPASGLAELGATADLAGWLVAAHLARSDTSQAVAAVESSRSRLLQDSFSGASAPADPPSSRGPVLYVGTGPLLSWVILVRPDRPTPTGTWTDFTARKLRPHVIRFRRARTRDEVTAALDVLTGVLGEAILTPARVLLETAGATAVDVVASGLLSGLPLHAMAGSSGHCWLDGTVVRYVPSGQLAQLRQQTRPVVAAHRPVLAFAGPHADLDCARHEPALIPRRLGPHVPVPGEGNRHGWLLNVLGEVGLAHFACHARWDPDDPLRSSIVLGGQHQVTLGEILELRLPGLRMAVLSCCSTGVPVERWADELLGFGTGMMIAGADSVVTSNWDLPDLPSSLLMARFYRLIGAGIAPAMALRDAQLWIRKLTVAEIGALVDEAFDETVGALLPGGLATEAERILWDGHPLDHRPFQHPVNWAGFSYHGAGADTPSLVETGEVR